MSSENEINEHDIVETTVDKFDIKSGSKGTVVHVYPNSNAFEVEFSNNEVKTFLKDEIKK